MTAKHFGRSLQSVSLRLRMDDIMDKQLIEAYNSTLDGMTKGRPKF